MHEVVDTLEDGECAADTEEEERDHEGPEVPLARSPEGMALVGRPRRQVHTNEEQRLVAGVGERMYGLCERGGRAREHRRSKLAHGDDGVAGECGQDHLAAVEEGHEEMK